MVFLMRLDAALHEIASFSPPFPSVWRLDSNCRILRAVNALPFCVHRLGWYVLCWWSWRSLYSGCESKQTIQADGGCGVGVTASKENVLLAMGTGNNGWRRGDIWMLRTTRTSAQRISTLDQWIMRAEEIRAHKIGDGAQERFSVLAADWARGHGTNEGICRSGR